MTLNMTLNEDKLVAVSVMGLVANPTFPGLPAEPYRLSADGTPFLLPTYGGVVYNVSVGDSAYGWQADCVHPGVSVSYPADTGNRGLNIFACVGNEAVVMTGEATGQRGVVTGKSGRFSEQVILHFPTAMRETIAIVVAKAPAHLLGAGAGLTSEGGSLHLQTTDWAAVQAAGLDGLNLGDLVALTDYDSRYQHGYLRGAVGIAVVGQTDGPRAGYGPGLTLLMTDSEGALEPLITPGTNLKTLLGLEA
jgi:hypothetical protein